MKRVYQIPAKVKGLSDGRKRKSIPVFNVIMPVLIAQILQYESFHTVFTAPESMGKRLKHLIKGRIPKVDAVRDVLTRTSPEEVEAINSSIKQTPDTFECLTFVFRGLFETAPFRQTRRCTGELLPNRRPGLLRRTCGACAAPSSFCWRIGPPRCTRSRSISAYKGLHTALLPGPP